MRRWGDGQGKHLTGTEHVPREGARVFSGSTQGGCQRSLGKHAQLCLSSLRRPLPRWGPSTARARPRDQGHVPILGLSAAAPIQGSSLTRASRHGADQPAQQAVKGRLCQAFASDGDLRFRRLGRGPGLPDGEQFRDDAAVLAICFGRFPPARGGPGRRCIAFPEDLPKDAGTGPAFPKDFPQNAGTGPAARCGGGRRRSDGTPKRARSRKRRTQPRGVLHTTAPVPDPTPQAA